MSRTSKILLACAAALVVVGAVAVKWIFFPSIKETYFTMNDRSLQQAPAGLVVVRPTHFAKSPRTGIMSASATVSGKRIWRIMGRDVTFKELMAVAYGQSQGRVTLPPGAPPGNFDFLVTVPDSQLPRLQTAIRKKLGYVAQQEIREADVLAMKIKDASLPGLTVSAAGTKPNADFKNGKLFFSHMRLQVVTGGLEQMLKSPVVDKTDLTNLYDFSTIWTRRYSGKSKMKKPPPPPSKKSSTAGGWDWNRTRRPLRCW